MKSPDLTKKTISDLEKELKEKQDQLRQLRFDLASGKVKNIKIVKHTRKDIARISTAITLKKNKEITS